MRPAERAYAALCAFALSACGPADHGAPSTPCTTGAEASCGTATQRDALMDPEACAGCHPNQYAQWAGSMHAYAGDDPLFVAMNARGQREAGIGDFCVKCHAPMAVRTGATTDGLNLAELPQKLKGVTCFFCHSVNEVNGSHDNPLELSNDGVMLGEYTDPAANHVHGSAPSKLHDRDRLESATLCGACHDIVNQHGAHIERTYSEWRASVFSQATGGLTCGQCHMAQSAALEPAAVAANVFPRRTHDHRFPGVDAPLTPGPDTDTLKSANQALLDTALQSAVCVRGAGAVTELRVMLDNVAGGHAFPSGSAQDRRAWIEITAYAGDAVIYESGQVPDATSVTDLDDPDVWSIRDCLLDADENPVHMFWEGQSYETNLLPAPLTLDPSDPRFYQTHVVQRYPRGEATLSAYPDRVSVKVKLLPFGLDVLDDLVESGDLVDGNSGSVADLRAALVPYQLGSELVWTQDLAGQTFLSDGLPMSCVTDTAFNVRADTVPAVNHERCAP